MKLKKLIKILPLLLAILIGSVPARAADFEAVDEGTETDHASYTETSVYFDGKYTGLTAWRLKGNVYITLDTLKRYGNTKAFETDLKNSKINIDVAKLSAIFGDDETTAFIKKNAGICYIPIKHFKEDDYVSLNVISEFAHLSWRMKGDAVYISERDGEAFGRVAKDSAAAPSLKEESWDGGGPTELNLLEGELAFLVGETQSFYKIKTSDGGVCYVNKDSFQSMGKGDLPDYIFFPKKKTDFSGGKFNMAWVYVPKTTGITRPAPEPSGGCDVLAPTWFHQKVNEDGEILNTGDRGFCDLAHKNGYKVWASITNDFVAKGSTDFTSKVLSDKKLMRKTVAKYLFYTIIYGADGINIDYETLKDSDREGFTKFCEEMAYYSEKLGFTLTAALPPYQSWYKEFDYKALGRVCDFITVMSYTERGKNAINPGPIASLPYMKRSIEKLSEYIPNEKLLLGNPFYSLLWTCNDSGKPVSAGAYTMRTLRAKVLDEWVVEPKWDKKTGQHYAEYTEEGLTYKVWLESKKGIAERLGLVYKQGLAGTCCWQYAQADDDVWEVFEGIYKDGLLPSDFSKKF